VAHAVKFNDKPGFMAVVVGKKRPDRMLPPEFQAAESAAPKHSPQNPFWSR
jgi:hypothetical protein